MADQPDAPPPPATPPAAVPGASRDRAAILAGMPFGEKPAEEAPKVEAKPVEKPAEVKADAEKPAEDEKPKTDDDADDDEEKVEAKPDEKPAEPADPESDRRRVMLAKTEKKQREDIAREKAAARAEIQSEVERVKASLSPQLDAVRRFEVAQKRAKSDPVAALRALGLSDEDFEHASRQLYYASPAAAKDPKNRIAAEQSIQRHEADSRVDQLQAKIDAMEAKEAQREQSAKLEQQKGQYLDHVAKGVTDETPLLQKLIAKNPTKARTAMWATAEAFFAETGEMPDAEDIAVAYEKQRRAELEDLGIDVAAVAKSKGVAAADPAKPPAKTLDTTNGTATRALPTGKKPTREQLLKEMPWGAGD